MARAKPCEEFSFADLRLQRTSDSAFDVTTSHTGGWTFSLDADVASRVGSAGWELGPVGVPTAQQWVAALEQEACDLAAPTRLSGPLLKLSHQGLGGWQLYWFEIGGGRVRYDSSPEEAQAGSNFL